MTAGAQTGAQLLVGAALDAIVAKLREAVAVDRCTLRLDVAEDFYPVAHEARKSSARTLIGDRSVRLQGQPVVEEILGGAEQVVQPNTSSVSEDPAFKDMLAHYGGLGAQIVTPVRERDRLLGIISLHHLGGPREWSQEELALARTAAGIVAGLLANARRGSDASGGLPTPPEDRR